MKWCNSTNNKVINLKKCSFQFSCDVSVEEGKLKRFSQDISLEKLTEFVEKIRSKKDSPNEDFRPKIRFLPISAEKDLTLSDREKFRDTFDSVFVSTRWAVVHTFHPVLIETIFVVTYLKKWGSYWWVIKYDKAYLFQSTVFFNGVRQPSCSCCPCPPSSIPPKSYRRLECRSRSQWEVLGAASCFGSGICMGTAWSGLPWSISSICFSSLYLFRELLILSNSIIFVVDF